MAVSQKKKLFIFNLIFIVIFCSYAHSGCAEDGPAQMVAKALFCFNNKFIYSGCDEAYRLNESGNINVPLEETDMFCSGPCLSETQLVLNCVDNVLSDFIFYNKASVRDIRYSLRAGCSFTSRRGNFDLGDYMQGEFSKAHRLPDLISFYALALIMGCAFLIL